MSSLLVVGASSELCLEILKERQKLLPDEKIYALYRNENQNFLNFSNQNLKRIKLIKADIENKNSVEILLSTLNKDNVIPENILFLASPKIENKRFSNTHWEEYNLHLKIQLEFAINILTSILPKMSKRKSGNIVFLLSSCVLGMPPAGISPYAVGKYALLGLMRTLAAEYGPKNISINAVSPSMIETNFLSELPEFLIKSTSENHPRKRNAEKKDIAPIVNLLLSKKENFLSGVNIPITGGDKI